MAALSSQPVSAAAGILASIGALVSDRLLLVAVVLLAGGVLTLALEAAGLPEALLEALYGLLPASLDLEPDPPGWARDVVSSFALAGGIAELVAGGMLLAIRRARSTDG